MAVFDGRQIRPENVGKWNAAYILRNIPYFLLRKYICFSLEIARYRRVIIATTSVLAAPTRTSLRIRLLFFFTIERR